MKDWNGNGKYDRVDSYIDYTLSGETEDLAAGLRIRTADVAGGYSH